MSNTYFWGVSLLAITFLLIVVYSLRKTNSFMNIREIICDYWKMLSSLRHRLIFMATPISFGIGLALVSPISEAALETLCAVIPILLSVLLVALGVISNENEEKEKSNSAYRTVVNETINTILYSACLSIADLLLVFMSLVLTPACGTFPQHCVAVLHFAGSIAVYSLTFAILLNFLIVVKRISRLTKRG